MLCYFSLASKVRTDAFLIMVDLTKDSASGNQAASVTDSFLDNVCMCKSSFIMIVAENPV